MKSIKFNVWEKIIINKILNIRKKEKSLIVKILLIKGFLE